MSPRIAVVLADDNALLRQSIRALLQSVGSIDLVGEANDGVEAVQLARELEPCVVILDVDLPRLDGIQATRQLRQLSSPPKVVVFTMHAAEELVFSAFEAGCHAYVLKYTLSKELIEAVHEVVEDRWYLSPQLRPLAVELAKRFGA